jgi:Rrf2 family protein
MTCRFTLAVHILGMLAWSVRDKSGRDGSARDGGEPVTSEELARSINTNPVVVRRVLGDLRRAGLVDTKRGVGGGVTLARPASAITLRDAYEAIEEGEHLFGGYPSGPNPRCTVGTTLAVYLEEVFGRAEESLKKSLGRVTVDSMVKDIVLRARTARAAS